MSIDRVQGHAAYAVAHLPLVQNLITGTNGSDQPEYRFHFSGQAVSELQFIHYSQSLFKNLFGEPYRTLRETVISCIDAQGICKKTNFSF